MFFQSIVLCAVQTQKPFQWMSFHWSEMTNFQEPIESQIYKPGILEVVWDSHDTIVVTRDTLTWDVNWHRGENFWDMILSIKVSYQNGKDFVLSCLFRNNLVKMWIQSKNILFIKSILVPTNQGRSIRMLDFQGIICNRDVVHKEEESKKNRELSF